MWPSRLGRSKKNTDDRQKYNLTKKIKTISFFKYWHDNILDRLGSTQITLPDLLPNHETLISLKKANKKIIKFNSQSTQC
jgi:hypothetical protein